MIFTLILLVGIGLLIWWLVRRAGPVGYGVPPGPPTLSRALEILDERYARGEINKEEYDERKREITAG